MSKQVDRYLFDIRKGVEALIQERVAELEKQRNEAENWITRAELKGLFCNLECDVHFWKTRAEKLQSWRTEEHGRVVEMEATIKRVEALIPKWDERLSRKCTIERIDLLLLLDELDRELAEPGTTA